MLMVEAVGLHRTFGDVVALDGLDLEVHPGEVVGLLGHNGAGKTTTVRLLNGLLTPHGGTARVLGLDPWHDGAELRARTGVLTEVPAMDGRLSARETLEFHCRAHGVPGAAARIDEVLETLGLHARAEDRVRGFSKGMCQRLALARAFVHSPELLFLDEPVAALDPVAAEAVHTQIKTLVRDGGRTVIVCTHNLVEAERLCDRVVVLEKGRVLAQGTPAELGRLHGSGATGTVEVAEEDLDRAAEALRAAGIDVEGTQRGTRSLEDVYFALHGRER